MNKFEVLNSQLNGNDNYKSNNSLIVCNNNNSIVKSTNGSKSMVKVSGMNNRSITNTSRKSNWNDDIIDVEVIDEPKKKVNNNSLLNFFKAVRNVIKEEIQAHRDEVREQLEIQRRELEMMKQNQQLEMKRLENQYQLEMQHQLAIQQQSNNNLMRYNEPQPPITVLPSNYPMYQEQPKPFNINVHIGQINIYCDNKKD